MKALIIILLLLTFSAFGDEKKLSSDEIQEFKRQETEQYAERHRLAELNYNKKKPSNNTSAIDYFQPKTNTIYHYDKLGVEPNGDIKHSLLACNKTKKQYNELFFYCDSITFFAGMEVRNEYVYKIQPNIITTVFIDNNMFGSINKSVKQRAIVPFYLPTKKLKRKWIKNDGNNSLCVSSFTSQITTKLKTFKNIVLAECEYVFKNKYISEKSYYAYGYGLVKQEQYYENELVPFMSKELVKIENKENYSNQTDLPSSLKETHQK